MEVRFAKYGFDELKERIARDVLPLGHRGNRTLCHRDRNLDLSAKQAIVEPSLSTSEPRLCGSHLRILVCLSRTHSTTALGRRRRDSRGREPRGCQVNVCDICIVLVWKVPCTRLRQTQLNSPRATSIASPVINR